MVAAAFTSSRKAFYDLQIQLAAGRIARRYVVLAHGWMPRTTQKIDAFLWWQGGSPTVAGASYGSKYVEVLLLSKERGKAAIKTCHKPTGICKE